MAGGDYRKYRMENSDVSATTAVGTTGASGGLALATGKASGSIFVQRLTVIPTTTGAVTWTLGDSSTGTTAIITPVISMTGTGYSVDYGSRGIQLATGANFQVLPSATGAAGVITFEAYWKYMGGSSFGGTYASGSSGTTP